MRTEDCKGCEHFSEELYGDEIFPCCSAVDEPYEDITCCPMDEIDRATQLIESRRGL